MDTMFYCPYCGHAPLFIERKDQCCGCGAIVELLPSKYDFPYYAELSAQKYNSDRSHWKEFLLDEISTNPLYDPNRYNSAEATAYRESQMAAARTKDQARREASLPKCPLCGSTKLKKISAVKHGVHAAAFGIFSKTAFSQFECESCHYKF